MCNSFLRGLNLNKRKKKAPHVIETMFSKLDFFLKLYNIEAVEIHLRSRISGHFYYLLKPEINKRVICRRRHDHGRGQ